MKRLILIFVLIVIYVIIISNRCRIVFSEKIDLNLKQDEIGIVLYDSNNLRFFIIKDDEMNSIIILKNNDNSRLQNILNVFGTNDIDNLISDVSKELEAKNYYRYKDKIIINNLEFNGNSDLYKIKIYDYCFCIYNDSLNNDLDDCTFTYFYKIDSDVILNEKNKVIFFGENIDNSLKELFYTKWIDTYELDNDNYLILKIQKDNYNIVKIPS